MAERSHAGSRAAFATVQEIFKFESRLSDDCPEQGVAQSLQPTLVHSDALQIGFFFEFGYRPSHLGCGVKFRRDSIAPRPVDSEVPERVLD